MSYPLNSKEIRSLCRSNNFNSPTTAGLCPGQIQCNLLILPLHLADDFRALCVRNPVSCPLLGESSPGDPTVPLHLAEDADVRTDAPSYNVYSDGVLQQVKSDVKAEWKEDSVAFMIGCSFSFEKALAEEGLVPRHWSENVNVPMYKTSLPLNPSGVFHGHTVVSMRPYRPEELERVRKITSRYIYAHGEPIAWGFDGAQRLGIQDISRPDFGDAVVIQEGEIPVFWGCGVTPQLAVMESGVDGIVMGHSPGLMLCLDVTEEEARRRVGWV